MPWKNKLPNCFGVSDMKFARHQTQKEHATELLTELVKQQVSLTDVEAETQKHLANAQPNHLTNELNEIRRLLGPWLKP